MNKKEMNASFQPSSILFAVANAAGTLPPCSLSEVVHYTISKMDESTLCPVDEFSRNPAFEPKFLLGILSCFYAGQIYSSLEICDRLVRDPNIRAVTNGTHPGPSFLSRFRHLNRKAIQECLTAALLFLARSRELAGCITGFNEAFVAEEARRRVIMAQFMDSMDQADDKWQEMLEESFTSA